MQRTVAKRIHALTIGALIAVSGPAVAETASNAAHTHAHDAKDIYEGRFDDDQIKARALSDWAGDWQSIYPYVLDGTLDDVFQHKAEHGDKTVAEYRDYYQTGYATDVERIVIEDGSVTFFRNGAPVQGHYVDGGHEVLTYDSGNRGVRYIFEKQDGDAAAPKYIQFSDHNIAPTRADHYHLYWGDDRAAVLQELTNWPTYFPARMSGAQIVSDMLAH